MLKNIRIINIIPSELFKTIYLNSIISNPSHKNKKNALINNNEMILETKFAISIFSINSNIFIPIQ